MRGSCRHHRDVFRLMGIAWFDDDAPPEDEAELRTGGRPLLEPNQAWPVCPQCSLPMLFRAQVPLAMTSLVPFSDDRLASLFECHAVVDGDVCTGSAVLVSSGTRELRDPPEATLFDVWLRAGTDAVRLARILTAHDIPEGATPPVALLRAAPRSMAEATLDALRATGADVELRPSPPTLLSNIWGGRMVPFDDGVPGMRRTTLPPLPELMTEMKRMPMRGIFGGATPGYRDHAFSCSCGQATRTAVRLLAIEEPDPCGATLGPSTLQFCTACGKASLLRMHGPRRLAKAS